MKGSGTDLFRGLGNGKDLVRVEILGHELCFSRGPSDFETSDLSRIAEAEVKRRNTMAQIA